MTFSIFSPDRFLVPLREPPLAGVGKPAIFRVL
jgi:hypothetical protein